MMMMIDDDNIIDKILYLEYAIIALTIRLATKVKVMMMIIILIYYYYYYY